MADGLETEGQQPVELPPVVSEGLPDPLAGPRRQGSGGRRLGALQPLWVLADGFSQEPDLREVPLAPDADQEVQPDCKAFMQRKAVVKRRGHKGSNLVAVRHMPDDEISQPEGLHVYLVPRKVS